MTATLRLNASGQNEQEGSRERSPLRPEHQQTSYGASDAAPRSPGPQSPPPGSATRSSSDEESQKSYLGRFPWRPSLPSLSNINKGLIACTAVFLIVLIVTCVKIGGCKKATEALRREAKHLENERIAHHRESTHLEEERIALESATRHSEQERLGLEKQTHLLEDQRRRMEKEELALEEERERWEKARDEQTIPKGAFWEAVLPAWDCRAYGKREYWGIFRNTPEGRSEMDACMSLPVEIKGVTIRRPYRCQHRGGSMNGFWMVDWDQPDCKPWHQDFVEQGCMNQGSGLRHIEAEVVGIKDKDWRLMCETTPMTWNHINYTSPAHCVDRGKKIAVWYVPDNRC
ncbi:hypothetical protein BJ322DRAFT_1071832 [Thelephora terrestris]|uniref:Uncharacterized protein n=1 Tax=Thelephora terrestris TaxID=56493 RepID=A0A9P6H9R4_9AGAM|nr:hypothetical protein BJ322DRAFT_1071832 [Thelephora terrestris]